MKGVSIGQSHGKCVGMLVSGGGDRGVKRITVRNVSDEQMEWALGVRRKKAQAADIKALGSITQITTTDTISSTLNAPTAHVRFSESEDDEDDELGSGRKRKYSDSGSDNDTDPSNDSDGSEDIVKAKKRKL